MTGTLINAAAIIVGGLTGLALRSRLKPTSTDIVFQVLGLFTVAIAVSMSLEAENMLFVIISLVAGALLGQWIGIDRLLDRFSGFLHRMAGVKKGEEADGRASSKARFTEGFITATMIFCIGSMAILGAMEDGLGQTPNLLYMKSIMDGVCVIALVSAFGAGAIFSVIPLVLYQGGITLLTGFLSRFMTDAMIADLTAAGGVILIGLAINLLKLKEINVVNMLPALLIAPVLTYFFG